MFQVENGTLEKVKPAIYKISGSRWGWVSWREVAEIVGRDPRELLNAFWSIANVHVLRQEDWFDNVATLYWCAWYSADKISFWQSQRKFDGGSYNQPCDFTAIYVPAGFANEVIDLCRRGVVKVYWVTYPCDKDGKCDGKLNPNALYYAPSEGYRWMFFSAIYASKDTPRIPAKRLF